MLRTVLLLVGFSALCAADLNDVDQYIAEHKDSVNPRYRLQYHIAAPIGWINDPNGFSYYGGVYHMFYQYYPYSSEWGPMHWGHATSSNLIDWTHWPTALEPSEPYDADGCFSGSAVEDDDGQLALLYTGYVVSDNGSIQTQNLALSSDGVSFQKFEGNPVIPTPPDGNWEFRDPKVWRREGSWYMVLGNQTPDGRGRVVLYTSDDLREWRFMGTVGESHGDLGYMWECPDIFELDGKHVLLMSPQGVEADGDRYRNLHQTGYFVGDFDYETGKFKDVIFTLENFRELDYGHDFYATQTTAAADGRRIVAGWMAMWESEFPEAEDGWAGAMTLLRELRLDADGILRMTPVEEALQLRIETVREESMSPGDSFDSESFIFELEVYATIAGTVSLEFYSGGDKKLEITWTEGSIRVDRNGDERRAPWVPAGELYWRIFVDTSSVELFCGDGEAVFSSRIYPDREMSVLVAGDTPVRLTQHLLRRSIE